MQEFQHRASYSSLKKRQLVLGLSVVMLLVIGTMTAFALIFTSQDLRQSASANCGTFPDGYWGPCGGGGGTPHSCQPHQNSRCMGGNWTCVDNPGNCTGGAPPTQSTAPAPGGTTANKNVGDTCIVGQSNPATGGCDGSGPLSCYSCPASTNKSGQSVCSYGQPGSADHTNACGGAAGTTVTSSECTPGAQSDCGGPGGTGCYMWQIKTCSGTGAWGGCVQAAKCSQHQPAASPGASPSPVTQGNQCLNYTNGCACTTASGTGHISGGQICSAGGVGTAPGGGTTPSSCTTPIGNLNSGETKKGVCNADGCSSTTKPQYGCLNGIMAKNCVYDTECSAIVECYSYNSTTKSCSSAGLQSGCNPANNRYSTSAQCMSANADTGSTGVCDIAKRPNGCTCTTSSNCLSDQCSYAQSTGWTCTGNNEYSLTGRSNGQTCGQDSQCLSGYCDVLARTCQTRQRTECYRFSGSSCVSAGLYESCNTSQGLYSTSAQCLSANPNNTNSSTANQCDVESKPIGCGCTSNANCESNTCRNNLCVTSSCNYNTNRQNSCACTSNSQCESGACSNSVCIAPKCTAAQCASSGKLCNPARGCYTLWWVQ